MSETFYITTPIYYVNSHPHRGHAYTTIVTDVFVRYRKLFGEETYFLPEQMSTGRKLRNLPRLRISNPRSLWTG